MSRTPRLSSPTGYYHVIARGIGKQLLFEERNDFLFYLALLKRCSEQLDILICAYCLMDNHIHLLLSDQTSSMALFMQKTGGIYAQYYNQKYERTGHLFQNRYLSEPIYTERHLLAVFRYILQNPEKAGISTAAAYEWSSYKAFMGNTVFVNTFVDTEVFKNFFENESAYAEFLQQKTDEEFMEYESPKRNDKWAREIICRSLNIPSGTQIQAYDRKTRDAALRLLKKKGIPIRQIARVTGINRGIIQRA